MRGEKWMSVLRASAVVQRHAMRACAGTAPLPGRHLAGQRQGVGDAAVEALPRQATQLTLTAPLGMHLHSTGFTRGARGRIAW